MSGPYKNPYGQTGNGPPAYGPAGRILPRPAGQVITPGMAASLAANAGMRAPDPTAPQYAVTGGVGATMVPGPTEGMVPATGSDTLGGVCEIPPVVTTQAGADAWNAAHPGCSPARVAPAYIAPSPPVQETKSVGWFVAGVAAVGIIAWAWTRKPAREPSGGRDQE